jgi:AcrR family transcriptional regulator
VTAVATHRKLRSDALRNRERIVASARTLFATTGLDTSVEEISREAGVGVGTLYRHFATKEELIDVVLEDAIEHFLGVAESALADPDAWSGFARFIEEALAIHAHNRGLKDLLATRTHGLQRAQAKRRRLRQLLVRLVERAQREGSLRADFSVEDMPVLFWGGYGVIDCGANAAPEVWRRYLGFMLDGLRSESATPQPTGALTCAQVERARKAIR